MTQPSAMKTGWMTWKKSNNLGRFTYIWDFGEILIIDLIDERGQTHQFEFAPLLNLMTFSLDM